MNIIRRHGWDDPFDLWRNWEESLLTESARRRGERFSPSLDLVEEDGQYKVHLDIPGIQKEDLEISVVDNVLSIKGERKSEKKTEKKDFYHFERQFGSFARYVELPTEVDAEKINASYKDGVLELTIPKSEKVKPKQIKVSVK